MIDMIFDVVVQQPTHCITQTILISPLHKLSFLPQARYQMS